MRRNLNIININYIYKTLTRLPFSLPPPTKMPVLSLPSLPGPICSDLNPTRTWIRTPRYPPRRLSIQLTATFNNNPCSSAGDFFRQLSVSSVVLIGLGLSSLWAFPPPASARIRPASPSSLAHAQETLGLFASPNLLHSIVLFLLASRSLRKGLVLSGNSVVSWMVVLYAALLVP